MTRLVWSMIAVGLVWCACRSATDDRSFVEFAVDRASVVERQQLERKVRELEESLRALDNPFEEMRDRARRLDHEIDEAERTLDAATGETERAAAQRRLDGLIEEQRKLQESLYQDWILKRGPNP